MNGKYMRDGWIGRGWWDDAADVRCQKQPGQPCAQCVARSSECVISDDQRRQVRRRIGSQQPEGSGRTPVPRSSDTADEHAILFGERARQDFDDSRNGVYLHTRKEDGVYHFGPACGYALFSSEGIDWITETLGPNKLQHLMHDPLFGEKVTWGGLDKFLRFSGPQQRREPLPEVQEARLCVQYYFDHFNGLFPLFDRKEVEAQMSINFHPDPAQDVGWYAAFNIIFAIGSLFRKISLQGPNGTGLKIDPTDQRFAKSWAFFGNCCSVLLDLLFQDTSLTRLSALVAMTFMTTLTENAQPTYMLIANAGRLAFSMGLHRVWEKHILLEGRMLEHQRNIFWIIYILEKDICFRCDRPSIINDDNIGISFPPMPISVEATSIAKEGMAICALSQLAYLQSRIYSHLISIKSRGQSTAERQRRIDTFNGKLQSWRVALPDSIRPQEQSSYSSTRSISALVLHFAYHHCRIVLNQRPLQINGRDDIQSEPGAWFRQPAICVSSARSMLQALRSMLYDIDRPFGLLWNVTSYPLPAYLVLFSNTLSSVDSADKMNDLPLMAAVVDHLESRRILVPPCGTLEAFRELQKLAMIYVDGKQQNRGVNDSQSMTEQWGTAAGPQMADERRPEHPMADDFFNEYITFPASPTPGR